MYAVIRAGGKQYRVAPGDVIRLEKQSSAANGAITFSDVLAVSPSDGQITRPSGEARVTGRVVEEGRADKVLVFHYKRKKQYKKLAGHRQPFTAVRITEIAFDGQHFKATDQPEARQAKPATAAKAAPAPRAEHKAKSAAHHAAAEHKKAKAKHKTAAKSPGKKKK
jgi:large subunit ribosomal protein L21